MRRPRREFTIFSLAAIDLFCSAMGAFMVISIVLIPYFRVSQNQAPQQEIAQLKEQLSKSSALALFGIVTHAKSIAVVVDLSGSINGKAEDPAHGKDYRPQVQKVCGTIIEGMTSTQSLQMIGFHFAPDGTPNGKIDIPVWQGAPVPMDAAGQTGAKAFVDQLMRSVGGGTPTRQALHTALGQNVEAIFLITDGAPNEVGREEGRELCDEIVKDITAQNGGKKEIHCIGVGEYNKAPFCVEFMEHLSKENKGQFLGMPDL